MSQMYEEILHGLQTLQTQAGLEEEPYYNRAFDEKNTEDEWVEPPDVIPKVR